MCSIRTQAFRDVRCSRSRCARDTFLELSRGFANLPDAAEFFTTLSSQEEGHAIVLSRVGREIRRGRLWTKSKDLHLASAAALDALFRGFEQEVAVGVTLARALDIVEEIEASEIDVVFDTLNASVDMRSRARFERFFVLGKDHLAYCEVQLRELRVREADTTQTARRSA